MIDNFTIFLSAAMHLFCLYTTPCYILTKTYSMENSDNLNLYDPLKRKKNSFK